MTKQHFSILFEISKSLSTSGKIVLSSIVHLKPLTKWGDINTEKHVIQWIAQKNT